jgi:ubiquinone/menaquinone biosynthesis C-methylase UbiE
MHSNIEETRAHELRRLPNFFVSIAADIGYVLPPGAKILDFGCGSGVAVGAWRAAGFEAFGCDTVLESPGEWLRVIERPYRLPFKEASFDLVVSNQVLEHVQDHNAAFREIRRVLKPGAISLHQFPPRWTPIEPHVLVPLATVIQAPWWLALWARLGIRNAFQSGLRWRDVAAFNARYLREQTTYLPRRELLAIAHRWFEDARFIEAVALRHGRRTRFLYPLVRHVPLAAHVYSGVRARLLLLRRDELKA